MFVVAALLLATGIAAATLYASNLLSGRTTVTESIGITGTLPTGYEVGVEQTSGFTVVSYIDGALQAYLVVTISAPAIQPTDVTMRIAGNSITPSCSPTVCTFTGLNFPLPGHGSVPVDVAIAFNVGGDFGWTAQAWAS